MDGRQGGLKETFRARKEFSTDVAGELVLHEHVHGPVLELKRLVHGLTDDLEKMAGQVRNNLKTLTKRMNVQVHHVEPEIQILTKLALLNHTI